MKINSPLIKILSANLRSAPLKWLHQSQPAADLHLLPPEAGEQYGTEHQIHKT